MCTQHEESQDLKIVLLGNVADGEEVAERFGHFLIVNIQECVVHPVMREFLSRCALRLCDLVLMVRENKILTARMDVDLLAEISLGHNRALDVPARTAVAPRRLPGGLTLFLGLPEYEIERIFLLILSGDLQIAETGTEIIEVLARKLAVSTETSRAEIDRTVFRICMPAVDKRIDHVNHIRDFFRSLRMNRRRTNIHAFHILLALCDITLGDD